MLIGAILTSLIGAFGTPEASQIISYTPSQPVIVEYRGQLQRQLRGDWETPDIVAVVYSAAWPESLNSLLKHLQENHTQVLLIVPKYTSAHEVNAWLEAVDFPAETFELATLDVDTAWIRDYGPLQTVDASGSIIWLDADYSTRPDDDVVPGKLAQRFGVSLEVIPEGLDGGALISNGRGLCVSTVEAFAQMSIPVDDPDTIDAIIHPLLEQLGCQILTLVPALMNDPTKHADMFAQFLGPNTLAIASFDAASAPEDSARMDQATRWIAQAAHTYGLSLNIVRIPHPAPSGRYYTYLNGLAVDDDFLVPQYYGVDIEAEAMAYRALAMAMPSKNIVPIPSDEIIALNGAIHCITLGLHLSQTTIAALGPSKLIDGLSTKHLQRPKPRAQIR
ncbi:MAG: agmatine deiminase family protein [Myxococcota bacterium]